MSFCYHDDNPLSALNDGQRVLLATTAYSSPDPAYVESIQRSRHELEAAGIATEYLLLTGNCHVDDARNSVVKEFLETKCTDLVFLDADVSWNAKDLRKLCLYARPAVVGAVYPYRDPGRRDEMPYRALDAGEVGADGLLEVEGLPTGFLRIRRHVLQELANKAAKFKASTLGEMLPLIFERGTTEHGRLSGDLHFCHKWRALGGHVHCDPEIRLGHAARTLVWGSLAASLRRQRGQTLSYAAERIRSGIINENDIEEVFYLINNHFAASPYVLTAAALLAREAKGAPIIEAGSGISTVLMAAANPGSYVYCLEHDPVYSMLMQRCAKMAGVKNIGLCEAPLANGWYDLSESELPKEYALGFCDGPPRVYGTRMRFFDVFGERCKRIIVDDANTSAYQEQLLDWCSAHKRNIDFQDGRLAIIS